MVTAMALFTANDTLTKVATADLPAGQIMAVRGRFSLLFVSGLIVAFGQVRRLKEIRSPIVALRGVLEAGVALTFLTALGQLQLANVTAILQATPLILTLFAVLFGLEAVGWRRWMAIAVGFVGVLLIVKPSVGGFNVFAGLAFVSAVGVAIRDLVTRSVAGHIPTVLVACASTAAVTLLGVGMAAFEEWRPLSSTVTLQLAAAAFFVTLGNLAIVKAFRIGELSVVSPFRYAVILTSLLAGYLVFGELPDLASVLGIVLVVLSGLYALHREQVRMRGAGRKEPVAAAAGEVP
jgi:drug/metabolite transporter (DMT)-like permease